MGGLRPSSRSVSAAAILGLVLVSVAMVFLIDTSSLANPTVPLTQNNPGAARGPGGVLLVRLSSNQNDTGPASDPLNVMLALGGRDVFVTPAASSTSGVVEEYVMTTDGDGFAREYLAAGAYLVGIKDETLDIQIPVQIAVGNETQLGVSIVGTAYPVVYSEASQMVPAGQGPRSEVYVEVPSYTPVANDSEAVMLDVHQGAGGSRVNATVVSQEQPFQGTDWLELGTATPVDPLNATSIVLTTWRYSMDMPPAVSMFGFPSGSFVAQDA